MIIGQLPDGILKISANTQFTHSIDALHLERTSGKFIQLEFETGPAFVLRQESNGWFVLPSDAEQSRLEGDTLAWLLPPGVDDASPAWLVQAPKNSPITLTFGETILVEVLAGVIDLYPYENRPHADVFGKRFSFQIEDGALLEKTLAAFYWDTLLPCVVERTRAAGFPTPDGFVLSTLAPHSYGGTYPDVDHEFQVKGRLAAGSPLDEDVARRMMELQFKLMREDPLGLWRNPCAVQSDGSREYHVQRGSLDDSTYATMFLITGNVEILEEAWLYMAATKNRCWLEEHIHDLEGAAAGIEETIDALGRVWSDVYFEDQVIQNGRVCDAQAFAANGFRLLAEMEEVLGRTEKALVYRAQSKHLTQALIAPLPDGYWDARNRRFANWIDRQDIVHDHIHLLSNELPVLFGFATSEQKEALLQLIDDNLEEFQRFPSFVALDLAGYTESEIGVGGPYDLCAAGRYWCWDAAFWSMRKHGGLLHRQLLQVAQEAHHDGFIMGERYDMDHVYYVDGSNWHGAAYYYEYPCVFYWVLVNAYLGLRFALDVDLVIAPCLKSPGIVEINASRFAIRYSFNFEGFTLRNLADTLRTFRVDLSALYPQADGYLLTQQALTRAFTEGEIVTLLPGESCSICLNESVI